MKHEAHPATSPCKVKGCRSRTAIWTCRKCGARTCAHHCGAKDTRTAQAAPNGIGFVSGTATCGKCWGGSR